MKQRHEKDKVAPVYIKSADHSWIPALLLKTYNGKATVAVPKFPNEQEMLSCPKTTGNIRYHDNQMIDLCDYPNNALPMQNVDSNGSLEDFKDMVDLPFLHEVRSLQIKRKGVTYSCEFRFIYLTKRC